MFVLFIYFFIIINFLVLAKFFDFLTFSTIFPLLFQNSFPILSFGVLFPPCSCAKYASETSNIITLTLPSGVGNVQKTYLPKKEQGSLEKSAYTACPPGLGLKSGIYCALSESPDACHSHGLDIQVNFSLAIHRIR